MIQFDQHWQEAEWQWSNIRSGTSFNDIRDIKDTNRSHKQITETREAGEERETRLVREDQQRDTSAKTRKSYFREAKQVEIEQLTQTTSNSREFTINMTNCHQNFDEETQNSQHIGCQEKDVDHQFFSWKLFPQQSAWLGSQQLRGFRRHQD